MNICDLNSSNIHYYRNSVLRGRMSSLQDRAINPLNAELNPICHLLALLGGATMQL